MKPRKPIAKVSKRRKEQNKEYARVKLEYMTAHQWCEACPILGKSPVRAVDLHHRRGRNATLLCDTRHFMAICRSCHNWVRDNTLSARIAGLICAEGKWNTPER